MLLELEESQIVELELRHPNQHLVSQIFGSVILLARGTQFKAERRDHRTKNMSLHSLFTQSSKRQSSRRLFFPLFASSPRPLFEKIDVLHVLFNIVPKKSDP